MDTPPRAEVMESFSELDNALRQAVKSGQRNKSNQLLRELCERFPVPVVDVVRKEVWGLDSDTVVSGTHASAELEDAVANVSCTGRSLGKEEKKQLQVIMSHWCGWDPTPKEHRNDPWMQYLRRAYQLPDLQPILDTVPLPEDLARYPQELPPVTPWLSLLAMEETYYIYNLEDLTMYCAGNDLSEVLDGLRKERWDEGETWDEVEKKTDDDDPTEYFPRYD